MEIAGFVLTGGRSSRMGRDKALLPVASGTLCERIGDVLSTVAEGVWLVGSVEKYSGLRYECLPDIHPGLGPLSGLEAALQSGMAEFHVISSCDAYNLDSGWLGRLIEAARQEGTICSVAEDAAGQWQPLCGVYRRACLPVVQKAIQSRSLRAMDLLSELNAKPVKMDGLLLNLNTPDEYEETVNAIRR